MFRFDNYCEEWATKFKLIQHNPKRGSLDKAFYRMDSFSKIIPLCANLTTRKNIAMAVVTKIDADAEGKNNKFFRFVLTAFILVKQKEATSPSDQELYAAEAKALGFEIAEKFLAHIENDKQTNPELKALNLDQASIFTDDVIYGKWWATEIMIENVSPRNLCVNAEDYV